MNINQNNTINPIVSVVIPSFNRFKYLTRALKSVVEQTIQHPFEIIVVDDCSTDENYNKDTIYQNFNTLKDQYSTNKNITFQLIRTPKNSKELFGFACAAYVRNTGVNIAQGEFIAFLDDDDWWTKNKLEIQLKEMHDTNCIFSSTEGYAVTNFKDIFHPLYNSNYYWEYLKNKLNLSNSFPSVWNKDWLLKHNTIITSSVILHKHLYQQLGNMKILPNGQEDYDMWLRCLDKTNCLYINTPLFYYDMNHGDGQLY